MQKDTINNMGEIIEAIKDYFVGCGVKQKEDGRIVTYFTPYSATEFTEKLSKHIAENYTPNSTIQQKQEEYVKVCKLLSRVLSVFKDEDDFVSKTYSQFMYGNEYDDDSIEMSEIYNAMSEAVKQFKEQKE